MSRRTDEALRLCGQCLRDTANTPDGPPCGLDTCPAGEVKEMAERCPFCGEEHERHEDAACGCGCGSNPIGCSDCMREGGPISLAQKQRLRDRAWRDLDEPPYGPLDY